MPTLRVAIDARNATAGAREFEQASRSISRSAGGVSNALSNIAAALGIGLGVREVVNTLVEFDSGLIAVGKTADLSGADLEDFGDQLLQVASTTGIATDALLETSAVAGQLGVQGSANILEFSRVINELASASDVVGESGATALAQLLNVTGETTDQVDILTDVLVRLGNNLATTEAAALGVGTELGKSLSIFGVTSTEAIALGAALAAVGVEGEAAATSFGILFSTIEGSVNESGVALQRLEEITGNADFGGLFGEDRIQGLRAFVEGLANIEASGGSARAELESMGITQQRVLRSILPLVNNTENLTQALDLMEDELVRGDARTREFGRAQESLGAAFQRIRNTLEAGVLSLRQYQGAFSDVLGEINSALRLLFGLNTSVDDVNETTIRLAASFKALGLAIAAIGLVQLTSLFVGLLAPIGSAIVAVGSLAATLSGPLLVAAAAVGAAFAAIEFGRFLFQEIRAVRVFTNEILTEFDALRSGVEIVFAEIANRIEAPILGAFASVLDAFGSFIGLLEIPTSVSGNLFAGFQVETSQLFPDVEATVNGLAAGFRALSSAAEEENAKTRRSLGEVIRDIGLARVEAQQLANQRLEIFDIEAAINQGVEFDFVVRGPNGQEISPNTDLATFYRTQYPFLGEGFELDIRFPEADLSLSNLVDFVGRDIDRLKDGLASIAAEVGPVFEDIFGAGLDQIDALAARILGLPSPEEQQFAYTFINENGQEISPNQTLNDFLNFNLGVEEVEPFKFRVRTEVDVEPPATQQVTVEVDNALNEARTQARAAAEQIRLDVERIKLGLEVDPDFQALNREVAVARARAAAELRPLQLMLEAETIGLRSQLEQERVQIERTLEPLRLQVDLELAPLEARLDEIDILRRRRETIQDFNRETLAESGPLGEFSAGFQDALDGFDDIRTLGSDVADTLRGEFNGFFSDFINGTQDVDDAFRDLLSNIVSRFAQVGFDRLISGFFGDLFGNIGGAPQITEPTTILGGGGPPIVPTTFANANGNVIGGTTVIPFAKGEAFYVDAPAPKVEAFRNGDLFNQKTFFPMGANTIGMLGEAGPEAIMPLVRAQQGLAVEIANMPGLSLPLERTGMGRLGVSMPASMVDRIVERSRGVVPFQLGDFFEEALPAFLLGFAGSLFSSFSRFGTAAFSTTGGAAVPDVGGVSAAATEFADPDIGTLFDSTEALGGALFPTVPAAPAAEASSLSRFFSGLGGNEPVDFSFFSGLRTSGGAFASTFPFLRSLTQQDLAEDREEEIRRLFGASKGATVVPFARGGSFAGPDLSSAGVISTTTPTPGPGSSSPVRRFANGAPFLSPPTAPAHRSSGALKAFAKGETFARALAPARMRVKGFAQGTESEQVGLLAAFGRPVGPTAPVTSGSSETAAEGFQRGAVLSPVQVKRYAMGADFPSARFEGFESAPVRVSVAKFADGGALGAQPGAGFNSRLLPTATVAFAMGGVRAPDRTVVHSPPAPILPASVFAFQDGELFETPSSDFGSSSFRTASGAAPGRSEPVEQIIDNRTVINRFEGIRDPQTFKRNERQILDKISRSVNDRRA